MVTNGKELYKFLDGIFLPLGYVRKKDTYYTHTAECICYFHISKSEYGGQYEDAMGTFFKPIYTDKIEFPPYYKDHLRYGLNDFVDRNLVYDVFDLENKNFERNDRENLIKEFIELYAVPFLKEISSKEGIIKAVDKYNNLKYGMVIPLREALGITIE
jgi:hypothetical protein